MKIVAQIVVLAVTLNAAGATPQPEGYSPEVAGILSEMISTYATAGEYHDSGQLTILQKNGRVRQITKMPSSTAFQRAGQSKLQVLGGMQSISCDGEHLQIVLDALKQYQHHPAPSQIAMEHVRMGAPGAGLDEGYPEILEFLIGEDVLGRWLSQMKSISVAGTVKVDQRPCRTISYETIHGAEINLFIDAESHLLMRCDIDNTAAQQSPNAPPSDSETPTLQVVLQLAPVEIESGLPENTFVVVKPESMRQVEVFEAQQPGAATAQAPEPVTLVGQAAPAIPDKDFADKPTLLFFWSPNAGPGNLAAIQMVERLRVGAEGSGVAFLGLAAAGADPQVVGDLLAAKKAGYPNTHDTSGQIAREYGIDTLPAFVLVGADGKIQHVTGGDPNAAEAELAKQLRNL